VLRIAPDARQKWLLLSSHLWSVYGEFCWLGNGWYPQLAVTLEASNGKHRFAAAGGIIGGREGCGNILTTPGGDAID
jgi:hypothetical protein